ncbi:MAG: type IV secretion system protein IcmL [marine bacterium B5-7]|nr:MAG: type IV secretion system protein IcmL [marine bacterium B5-7]
MSKETADEGAVTVQLRHTFYRDNYRRLVGVLLLAIMIIVGLASVNWYLVTHRPAPQYFATSGNGRIMPLIPLSQPNLSKAAVLQWSTRAAIGVYTYNFVNYRKSLQDASGYFTTNGWKQFMNALQASNNLQAVTSKKLVVSAVPTGAPVIIQEGIVNGRYTWKIQLPILVTYQSASQNVQVSLMITMVVTRVPSLNTPEGIGIAQFVAEGS